MRASVPNHSTIKAGENNCSPGVVNALPDLLAQLDDGMGVELQMGQEYPVEQGAMNCDLSNVVVLGGPAAKVSGTQGKNGARIKLVNGGTHAIKWGDASRFTSATQNDLICGSGLYGVSVDLNNQVFTDAPFVTECIYTFVFSHNNVQRAGLNTDGNYSRLFRMQCTWDSWITGNRFRHLYSPNGEFVLFDDYIENEANPGDMAGNCNNIRFNSNHWEQFYGTVFRSTGASNLDHISIWDNKFELGAINSGAYDQNWVADLDNAHRVNILANTFNKFLSNRYQALYRIGATGVSTHALITNNHYLETSCREVDFGEFAAFSRVFGNTQMIGANAMGMTNVSQYPIYYEPPISTSAQGPGGRDGVGLGAMHQLLAGGAGWVSVNRLSLSNLTSMVSDTSSVSTEKSVLRVTTTAQGTVLVTLPWRLFADCPYDVDVLVRVKKANTGAVGSLQLNGNQATINPSALADNTNWQVIKFPCTVSTHLSGLGADTNDRFRIEYGASNATQLLLDAVMFVVKTTAS